MMIRTSNIILLICFSIHCTKAYWHVSSTIEKENEISDLTVKLNTGNGNVLKFTAFGNKFDLTLAPLNNIFGPQFQVLSAKSLPNGQIKFEQLKDTSTPLKGSFFQIAPTGGAVYLDQTGDSYQLEGIIDDDKRLVNDKPNSYKLIKLGWENATKSPFEGDNNVASSPDHQIWKRKLDIKSLKKKKVTIETLVILDYWHVKRLEQSKVGIKKYLGIYWNSVRRRFADIDDPKIDFVLVGAIRADSRLIFGSTFKHLHLNGTKLLDDLSYWLYSHKKRLPRFDVVMLQTSLDLASYTHGKSSSGLLGRAYVGTVCYSTLKKRLYNCGIGEDIAPIYSGILTTAHEVAHILGAPHDGTSGAYNCPADAGYLMGQGMSKGWHFSECSKKILRNKLNGADCLNDVPKYVIPIGPNLPGEVISLDAICQGWYGADYKMDEKKSDCRKVWCHVPGTSEIATFGGAPEGTACGGNKVCLNGECADKHF